MENTMRKLLRKFIRWINEMDDLEPCDEPHYRAFPHPNYRLYITPVMGGTIVVVHQDARSYPGVKLQAGSSEQAYIITDDANFTEELSKILVAERLSR